VACWRTEYSICVYSRFNNQGNDKLKSALLGKISFWLIVIGSLALLTPQPAWPEWLARMILSSGIALGVTTLGVLLWKKRSGNGNE
jgi:Na+/proline symporter